MPRPAKSDRASQANANSAPDGACAPSETFSTRLANPSHAQRSQAPHLGLGSGDPAGER